MSDHDLPELPSDSKDWTWVLARPCPDCGFDAARHPREELGIELRRQGAIWRSLLAADRAAERLIATQWSALEYGCHVRDVLGLGIERTRRMIDEDDPLFANWDQDDTAREQRYSTQDPAQVAYDLALAAGRVADIFDGVDGPQWARTGRRGDGASFTIESFGRYLLHDPVHHVWDVRRAQGEPGVRTAAP